MTKKNEERDRDETKMATFVSSSPVSFFFFFSTSPMKDSGKLGVIKTRLDKLQLSIVDGFSIWRLWLTGGRGISKLKISFPSWCCHGGK